MMGNVKMASKNKGSARNTLSEDMKRTLVNGPNGPYRMKKTHKVDIVWEDLRDQFETEQDNVDFWELIISAYNLSSLKIQIVYILHLELTKNQKLNLNL